MGSELLFHSPRASGSPISISLIPINKDGYFHLCQLITLSKRRAEKGFSQLDLGDLEKRSEFLYAFPKAPWNEDELEILKDLFGDRLFLPVRKDYTWESL